MTDGLPEEVQRWTAKRRSALIVSIIEGETSVQEAARKHGLTVAEVEDWREKFFLAAENALRTKPRDEEAQKDEQIKKLKQKVGQLVWSWSRPASADSRALSSGSQNHVPPFVLHRGEVVNAGAPPMGVVPTLNEPDGWSGPT